MFTFDHDDITRKSSFQKRKEKEKYSEYRKRLAEKFNILEGISQSTLETLEQIKDKQEEQTFKIREREK